MFAIFVECLEFVDHLNDLVVPSPFLLPNLITKTSRPILQTYISHGVANQSTQYIHPLINSLGRITICIVIVKFARNL